MSILPKRAALAVLICLGAAPVAAQTDAPDPETTPQAPTVCRDESGALKPCENLSEQLGDTGGVIQPPPAGDPEIAVPAPDPSPNTTPVIPPGQLPEQQTPDGTVTEQ